MGDGLLYEKALANGESASPPRAEEGRMKREERTVRRRRRESRKRPVARAESESITTQPLGRSPSHATARTTCRPRYSPLSARKCFSSQHNNAGNTFLSYTSPCVIIHHSFDALALDGDGAVPPTAPSTCFSTHAMHSSTNFSFTPSGSWTSSWKPSCKQAQTQRRCHYTREDQARTGYGFSSLSVASTLLKNSSAALYDVTCAIGLVSSMSGRSASRPGGQLKQDCGLPRLTCARQVGAVTAREDRSRSAEYSQ
ncbi:hypothetical protein FKP32DRAFT_1138736 [Trametes sanguinea]|nr:hypothetical protein FKP32DRAFT_1138736 [Trametes sanguinea]